jgi:hypothetical protein
MMTVLWDVESRNVVEVYRGTTGACCLLHRLENGWSKHP